MKILGIDVGEKRIGLAVSDELGIRAYELGVVEANNFANRLSAILKEHNIEKIVVGRPRSLSGDLGPQAKRIQDFVKINIEPLNKEIIWEDETLTTAEAKNELLKEGLSIKEIKQKIDVVAAKIILQGYLNHYEKKT